MQHLTSGSNSLESAHNTDGNGSSLD